MKKRFWAAVMVAALLCGCSSGNKPSVNVIDAGSVSPEEFPETSSLCSSSAKSSSAATSAPVFSSTSSRNNSSSSSYKSSSSVTSSSSFSNESDIIQSSSAAETVSSAVKSSSSERFSESTAESTSSAPEYVPDYDEGVNNYQALNYSEVRGMWISYIELTELDSSDENTFRKSIGRAFDDCVSLGINTVYVHVRSHGDAYYSSDLFPRAKYLGGNYDALEVMVEEAHSRDLSFQAWINPLRCCSAADIDREQGYPIYDWAGGETRLVQVGDYYYLNPAYREAINLIADGVEEIVANYDVDGVHIDDYFYPTTEEWFDSAAFYESGYSSLSDFRFANCDNMVSSIYNAVKKSNSSAVFGVSCQGNVDNNYSQMYADVKKWCRESEYLDYIMPQIYFGFENSSQPFSECVSRWDEIASAGKVPLIVGLTAAKFGNEDKWAGSGSREWITDSDILKRQFIKSSEQASYSGICLYSYRYVFTPGDSVAGQVDKEIEALKSVM